MAYQVDSFHINVDAGDAAIHILSSPPTPQSNGLRVVQRAVMIDGGQCTGGYVRQSIYNTVLIIERKFLCTLDPPTNLRRLVFDCFIITHFDKDHCTGVLQFLLEDAEGNLTNLPLYRAKYDPDGTPQSYMFAPHWDVFDQNVGKEPPKKLENFMWDEDRTILGLKSMPDIVIMGLQVGTDKLL